jgi:Xaa-Pro aminopeptidase
VLNISDQTAFVDRLLMGKMESEAAAIRRAARVADEGYRVFMNAARSGRSDYELIAESEAFFRANGVDDNFQITTRDRNTSFHDLNEIIPVGAINPPPTLRESI